ncbi:MAG: hypothetical protein AAF495_02115 [Pseudomonadota bacterium]
MTKRIIHTTPGLVEVSYRDDLEAIYLKWLSEYDEGTAVRDAVHAALDHVRENDVRNWLADVSTSPRGLSEADQAWVTGEEFRTAIAASPLRRFVLIPPLPETGQDTSWLADWEANTLAKFGDQVQAKLSSDLEEIRAFFLG